MAVSAADLVCYASAGMPTDDAATSGGAIDPDTRVTFTQMSVDDDIEVVSSSAGDTTQQITVRGRNQAGAIVSQTVTLQGTTVVTLTTLGVLKRVTKVSLNADCAGTVTVRQTPPSSTVLGTIPPGERGFVAFLREVTAGSGALVHYYKVFIKNNHATDTLSTPKVSQYLDPLTIAQFAVAGTVNDTGSVTNRLTAPSLTFDDLDKNSPANLAPGDRLGIWLKVTIPAGAGETVSSYSLRMEGT